MEKGVISQMLALSDMLVPAKLLQHSQLLVTTILLQ
jgi:hypothetical protein